MFDSQIGDLPHLTPARLKFVEGILAGKTQTEAFLEAFPRAANWRKPHVWTQASRLRHCPKVIPWIDLAREQGVERANRSLEGHLKRLEDVQRLCWENIKISEDPRDKAALMRVALEAEKQHASALGHSTREESTASVTVVLRSFADKGNGQVIDGQAKEVTGPALLDAPRQPCEAGH